MATRISINKLCRGCMMVLENQETLCPICGFDKNDYPTDKKKLRVDFILKGQYLVGNALNTTPYENTYIGWNLNQDSRVVIKEFLPSRFAVREDYSTGAVMAAADEYIDGFKSLIDNYVSKAEEIMADGGKAEITDVFRENGTAYYVMPAKDEEEHYRLMAFTYVDGQSIDDVVEQARPRKPERVFVQPARSTTRTTNYGAPSSVYSGQPVYTPEVYVPRGNISAHVMPDERIEYKPETTLPSLNESNREAKEREREKELERKIEKRIEERLEKQLEERIEKQIVRSNGVFSINPDFARTPSEPTVSVPTPEVTPVNTGVNATPVPPVNTYRGMINVNGKVMDSSQPSAQTNDESIKKSDKPKLSEIKICGLSLSMVASVAICVVIIILVITTLVSKNGDDKTTNANNNVNASGTGTGAVAETDETIVFENADFDKAVRSALGLTETEKITASYLADVEKLDISGAGLNDVSELQCFTGLKELNLSKNKLDNIDVLSQLTELARLDISNCKLSDVSVLSGLTNLEYVNLIGNSVEDYSVVDHVKLVNGRYCKFYFTYVYHREDFEYKGYSLWSWHSATIGGDHQFTSFT